MIDLCSSYSLFGHTNCLYRLDLKGKNNSQGSFSEQLRHSHIILLECQPQSCGAWKKRALSSCHLCITLLSLCYQAAEISDKEDTLDTGVDYQVSMEPSWILKHLPQKGVLLRVCPLLQGWSFLVTVAGLIALWLSVVGNMYSCTHEGKVRRLGLCQHPPLYSLTLEDPRFEVGVNNFQGPLRYDWLKVSPYRFDRGSGAYCTVV